MSFTIVEESLQIAPFYAKRTQIPKKSNERKLSSNNELRKKRHLVDWEKTNPNEPKQTQSAREQKLMQSLYLQRIMKKNAAKGYEKTKPKQTQFKPNSPKSQNERKLTIDKGLSESALRSVPENKPKTNPISKAKKCCYTRQAEIGDSTGLTCL